MADPKICGFRGGGVIAQGPLRNWTGSNARPRTGAGPRRGQNLKLYARSTQRSDVRRLTPLGSIELSEC